MSSPWPTRQEEAFGAWWQDAENSLLEEFTKSYLIPMYGEDAVPLAKDWTAYDQGKWDSFVQREFEAQGPDEDSGRER